MKKNYKKNFFNAFVNKPWKKVFLFFIGIVSSYLILSFTFSANIAYVEPIKSVEIVSDGWSENEEEREPGSWHIEKSAEWTGLNKAQIEFKLDTTPKFMQVDFENYDVVFTLDVSTSMYGDKFTSLKESAHKYINEILSDGENRIAIAEYHTTASVLSGFTNNADILNEVIDNLELKCKGEIIDGVEQDYGYCTNYYDGLVKTEDILEGYIPDKDRQLVVLFLTDGAANRDNSLIRGQYELLKEKYPDIVINGIQYEMGSNITYWLTQASDYQYDAYTDTIYDRFFEATYRDVLESYEEFEVSDYIGENFYVNSVEDITVSKGQVELTEENGLQKIIWTFKDDEGVTDFKTGSSATMTINATYIGQGETKAFYPTNEKEVIKHKLQTDNEKIITESDKTPVLQNAFEVIYDPNLPSDCKNSLYTKVTKYYQPFQVAQKSNGTLTCEGYVFKGWEYADSSNDVEKVSEETFIMPAKDVEIKAVWGTLDISKKMEGKVYVKRQFLYDVVKEGAISDTNIDFKLYSSDTNGRGNYLYTETQYNSYPVYYYRGAVTNNNIIFAGFCWKIVRTTETGGTKLIYNGVVGTGNTCNNTSTASQIGASIFNSAYNNVKYMGYMYNTTTSSTIKGVIDSWYKTNIESQGYSGYLEDTVWCADRNGSKVSGSATYYGFDRRSYLNKEKPIVTCPLQADSYTVDKANGNGLLTYPVALLTGDEAQLSGYAWTGDNGDAYSTDPYIYTSKSFWLLSPGKWRSSDSSACVVYIYPGGSLSTDYVDSGNGVRPSVSLLSGTIVTTVGNAGEEGSAENPYIVE